ncbi:RIP metalloprotease RseP [Inconstantimicrobium mannanitabidum]|uniref:Zinc metalloprotease n=1 Tax=Inconstantimicrobium mannanitabidum TaxID=1604901 RepID=A0ACB5RB89_9CLOT|nr:RIP metalloprotease RseP [Clostridium sp. TW13]GKX66304.1 zinc metalloprotease [Clostridium sp. TW13]
MSVVNIILVVLAFSLLIIVHELGHFVLAKINGVKVLEFSLGMGPKIWGFKIKETEYNLKAFPIGGYVNMYGQDAPVDDPDSFSSKSPWRRITIVSAGVIMNFLLAIIIFVTVSMNFGFSENKLGDIQDNMPAKEAGLQKGDEIVRANGHKVFTSMDISVEINNSVNKPVKLDYLRNGVEYSVDVTPKKKDNAYMIGIIFANNTNPTFLDATKHSFKESATLITQTYRVLKNLFTGKADVTKEVGGPVTIVKMSNQAAQAGVWNLLYFTGYISIQLAIMNLLPFPALDGGWLIILLIEAITRKKVPDKVVQGINSIGFIALMALMVLVTIKDILYPIKF